ncbi:MULTISPECIES: hypothetical protein [Pantoea]|jgi:hypothetical protein|uniref:hypothetical protein n=1 Tax=Pantoea TaxID=53335 RepID=UPI0002323653|nr:MULTISPECIES: hypothetical protein [Pantoea]AER33222.1 hypothetical protein PAGR_g2724 [Pantoea ananatis PA13]AMB75356.1 hypothetical protein AW734_11735 [Pantoea ananatis]KNA29116.1 hypothetical protein ACO03_09200 [Pantoea ananatis]MCK0553040.1 hypothetical protein [Pantoea ananatis]MCS3405449.1 hypothetical protein [Pantoea sp. B566]
MKLKSFIALSLVSLSFGSQAASFVVDAKNNCFDPQAVNSKVQSGSPLKFNLDAGTYNIYLTSNSANCVTGSSCQIDRVVMAGGMSTARWGSAISSTPQQINVAGSNYYLIAYIGDDNCADNTGSVTIQADKVQ